MLSVAAALFTVSALASSVAPNFGFLVLARMIGGLGVGAALVVAPMYIAEIAPAGIRGRMVSFNQLNIVVGISAAFFSNFLILKFGQSEFGLAETLRVGEWNWRWMLGAEILPAILYLLALRMVPESPRWLAMQGRDAEALQVFRRFSDAERAGRDLADVRASLDAAAAERAASFRELFQPAMKSVLTIGIAIAILQQITGINAVFFYAPMIFEQSGIGTDASFMQAVLVGVVNLVFTIAAIACIDKLGRRPLLVLGLTGIAISMLALSYGFGSATYSLDTPALASLPEEIDRQAIAPLEGRVFDSDVAFRLGVTDAIGTGAFREYQSPLVSAAIDLDPMFILLCILGFVASFAMSLGPVMWVMFSELFPNRLRGLAISLAGLVNSTVSFAVQLVFPWELTNLGSSLTFLFYGLFALLGLVFVLRLVPETKGHSLEELEHMLVGN